MNRFKFQVLQPEILKLFQNIYANFRTEFIKSSNQSKKKKNSDFAKKIRLSLRRQLLFDIMRCFNFQVLQNKYFKIFQNIAASAGIQSQKKQKPKIVIFSRTQEDNILVNL